MKTKIGLFMVFIGGMFSASVSYAESVYYVQSSYARILSEPSFGSKVVTVVGLGEKLTSTGNAGSWVKIVIGGKGGYVPLLLVSTHPPLKRVQVVRAKDPEINSGVRRRASAFLSAAASRGLTKEDRDRLDTDERTDFSAVKNMESFMVSDSEFGQFVGEMK